MEKILRILSTMQLWPSSSLVRKWRICWLKDADCLRKLNFCLQRAFLFRTISIIQTQLLGKFINYVFCFFLSFNFLFVSIDWLQICVLVANDVLINFTWWTFHYFFYTFFYIFITIFDSFIIFFLCIFFKNYLINLIIWKTIFLLIELFCLKKIRLDQFELFSKLNS